MLQIFSNLFKDLHKHNIVFCNWKSHSQVASYLDGGGDLDIFVPLEFSKEFIRIAQDSGFRKVISYQANHEYIEHFYGFDTQSFKFAHIHVYFKIITGEHVSKNYNLPLENYILKNIDNDDLLPVTNKEAKKAIFLIRYFLKIGSIFGLLQYIRELDKYESESDYINLNEDIPISHKISELDLSAKRLNALARVYISSSILKKIGFAIRFKLKLKTFRRKKFISHQAYIFKNLIIRFMNRLFFKKKKLFRPGMVLAICGLDGSGKSSQVLSLKKIFSEHFSVKVFHLGRPNSNIFSFIPNFFIKIYSFLNRLKVSSKKNNNHLMTRPQEISIVLAIRSVLLAYDRKVQSDKAHRYSGKGYLVICDRYPGLEIGKMDSPRIPINLKKGSLYQLCQRLETRFYNSIKPSTLLFKLNVPLEIAIDRNNKRTKFGKETEDELCERFTLNSNATFLAEHCYEMDGTKTFESLLSHLIDKIWHYKRWIYKKSI